MTHRQIILGAAFLSLTLTAGCTLIQPPDEQPGLNRRERHALTESFYWEVAGRPTPSYTPDQLDALLRRTTDPTLDGERAEAQCSRLALALAVVGDEVFAEALLRQSATVRAAYLLHSTLYSLTGRRGLHYPRTSAALLPHA